MLLSLNGLPIVTIELKNPFTGQTAEHAKRQYRYDRDYKELLFQFKKRALVHFAVDTDVAFMATRLNGAKTYYLPFNQGHNNGKGNPPNKDGYRTDYLWNEVWRKGSLMEIIGKFMHIETEEIEIGGKIRKKEILFFPRYHQMDVVRELVNDVKEKEAGQNYLIQHSAGSGKSKSIAWLSYQLFSLHNKENERIFNAVIVITDRTVLDSQLQSTIYQIEHKQGVVQKIDQDSAQLADSLTRGGSIIITTLQKFPFVLDKIGDLPSRNYAVIIDEAHSSQGGEATKKMKEVLAGASLEDALVEEADTEDEDTALDEIRRSMLSRGRQPNLSFFAFTATPKAKTLEVFGTQGIDGKPRPFHLYSMRQAIEEGFILDVLKNYTTSGKVIDEGVEFTEPQMNSFGYKELRKKFATDDYQILLVADKYQTGFDQPLLHTMYVDKKLSGVKAVQTLSRLNRTASGKEDTFVLDFVNNRETILASFQPYYEVTTVEETTDPNHLYDLKTEIEKSQIIWQTDIDKFNEVYFSNAKAFNVKGQAKLQKIEEGQIALQQGEEGQLSGVKEAGVRYEKEEFAPISEIIEVLNDRLGTDFTPADQLFFDQIEEEMVQDETLAKQAQSNTKENFKYGFEDKFMDAVIERMEQNQELFAKLMDDDQMAAIVKSMLLDKVFKRLNEGPSL